MSALRYWYSSWDAPPDDVDGWDGVVDVNLTLHTVNGWYRVRGEIKATQVDFIDLDARTVTVERLDPHGLWLPAPRYSRWDEANCDAWEQLHLAVEPIWQAEWDANKDYLLPEDYSGPVDMREPEDFL